MTCLQTLSCISLYVYFYLFIYFFFCENSEYILHMLNNRKGQEKAKMCVALRPKFSKANVPLKRPNWPFKATPGNPVSYMAIPTSPNSFLLLSRRFTSYFCPTFTSICTSSLRTLSFFPHSKSSDPFVTWSSK